MSPELHFRAQPFAEEDAAGSVLRRVLDDPAISSFLVAVAWARFGGLARMEASIAAFRRRGGSTLAVIGIDEGGASRPGLLKALGLFDQVFVLHDPTGRTFHPKIYLATGPTKGSLLVGSSNATAGGLFFNYEASLEAEFQLPAEDGHQALLAANRYFELLREDTDICVELTEELIADLVEDPRYPIAETERRKGGARSAAPPEGTDDDEIDAMPGGEGTELSRTIFGASRHQKPATPGLPAAARTELAEIEAEADQPIDDAEAEEQAAPSAPAEPAVVPRVSASWSKKLTPADAQQPTRPGTNPIGNLRLTKAGMDIDPRTWFREELFGSATWNAAQDTRGNNIEETTISFDVTVGGVSLGVVDVRISHGEHRVAGQFNIPTVLHWGTDLRQLLRQTDYSGHVVTIERRDDGSYTLSIAP